ncbi:MAG: glycine-rich protein [Solirubrobacteraceae bacterium]
MAALLGAALMAATPSLASATVRTQTFSVPGQHLFPIPPAVTHLSVTLVGGNGGAGQGNVAGGVGATERALLTVKPGEKLYVEAGGNGGPAGGNTGDGIGGYNGGGNAGETFIVFTGLPTAGGGGGASDIRTLPACSQTSPNCPSPSSRLVVAAGGGGGGGTITGAGGPGGPADMNGTAGSQDNHGDATGGGGLRGTTGAGGAAGAGGYQGTAGTFGQGGTGATNGGGSGGGGGGGVYGGGGGGSGEAQFLGPGFSNYVGSGGGGGGGGSSMLPPGPPGVSNLSLLPTAPGAQPKVVLRWKVPPPTPKTGHATAIKSTSAVLHGAVNPNASHLSSCYFTISPATVAGSKIFCSQQVGSGILPRPVSAVLLGLKPSTKYTVRLVAANAQGVRTGAPVTFTTHPPPPRLARLQVGSKLHKRRTHQKITVTLSQPAKLTLTFLRLDGAGGTPFKVTQSVAGHMGINQVPFHAAGLQLGHYRLTVGAINLWHETAVPLRAVFRLVR